MKKLMSLILVLIFAFAIGTVAYAAEGDINIEDPELPAAPVTEISPAENVLDSTYVDVQDEDTPLSSTDSSAKTIDIAEEEPPKADALPNTGGIPAEAFYAIGALFIVAALILFRKKASAR